MQSIWNSEWHIKASHPVSSPLEVGGVNGKTSIQSFLKMCQELSAYPLGMASGQLASPHFPGQHRKELDLYQTAHN